MKKRIKVFFSDFWPNFEICNNTFYNLLKQKYDLEIAPDNPDYLFYSVFGIGFQYFNCTRIFFSGENVKPNFTQCDYSFSFELDRDNPRSYRLPQYYQYGDMNELTIKPDIKKLLNEKKKFCNFIYSNPYCKKRNEFFKKLSKYKKVDSAGRFLNNIGMNIGMSAREKWEFLKPYKFTIAFENEKANFYTSEKIYEAMKVNSLPIYWGNPLVHLDFNPESFLNYHDYGSEEALIQKIIEIDKNDELYIEYLERPYFKNNKPNEFVDENNILKQFDLIFSTEITLVASKSPIFSTSPIIRTGGKAALEFSFRVKKIIFKVKKFIKAYFPQLIKGNNPNF